jgi:hypothetical protein
MRKFFILTVIVAWIIGSLTDIWAGQEIIVKREAAEKFATHHPRGYQPGRPAPAIIF